MHDVLGRGRGRKVVVIVFDRLGPRSLWQNEVGKNKNQGKNLRLACFKAGIMEPSFFHL